MRFMKSNIAVICLGLLTLPGCSSIKPQVISHPAIPSYLADDSSYAPLKGHYYLPIPDKIQACQAELKLVRMDVVNCVIGHRNNNAEMEAIRKLNE